MKGRTSTAVARRRENFIHFRVGPAEREALRRLSELECLGISETMRLVLREAAKRRGVWPSREMQQ